MQTVCSLRLLVWQGYSEGGAYGTERAYGGEMRATETYTAEAPAGVQQVGLAGVVGAEQGRGVGCMRLFASLPAAAACRPCPSSTCYPPHPMLLSSYPTHPSTCPVLPDKNTHRLRPPPPLADHHNHRPRGCRCAADRHARDGRGGGVRPGVLHQGAPPLVPVYQMLLLCRGWNAS